jgi:hypothetical protein
MKAKFTVFYSWQSDKIKNKNFISSNLDRAIRALKSQSNTNEFNVEINIDRDTQNQSGSPAIAQTIFNKILESDIFVCDVSLINNTFFNRQLKNRLTPNPNVLIELGYAIHLLGWERIICVNNVSLGENELLPFDLRGHRISTFNGYNVDEKAKLTSIFKSAIKSIVDDYEGIVSRYNDVGFKKHDINIFNDILKLAPEQRIRDTVNTISNSLFYNGLHYEYLNCLQKFYSESINHFINKNIEDSFLKLSNALEEFVRICLEYIIIDKHTGKNIFELESDGVTITEEIKNSALQNERYFYPKEPFRNEDWKEYHIRQHKVQLEFHSLTLKIDESYKNFISTYKQEIL